MMTNEEIKEHYPKAFNCIKNLEKNTDDQYWEVLRNEFEKNSFDEFMKIFYEIASTLTEDPKYLKEMQSEDFLNYHKAKLGMM